MGVGSTSSHPLSALFPDARSGKSIKQKNFSPFDIFPRRNPMLGECDADAAAGGPSAFSHTQKLSTREEENAENSFFCSRRGWISPFCFFLDPFPCGKRRKSSLVSTVGRRFAHTQSIRSRRRVSPRKGGQLGESNERVSLTRRWTLTRASAPWSLGISCFRFAFWVRHGPYLLEYWVFVSVWWGREERVENRTVTFSAT